MPTQSAQPHPATVSADLHAMIVIGVRAMVRTVHHHAGWRGVAIGVDSRVNRPGLARMTFVRP